MRRPDLKTAVIFVFVILSAACATTTGPAPQPASVTPAISEGQKLDKIVDGYFERQLELNPILASSIGDNRYNHIFNVNISEAWRNKSRAVDQEYLALIGTVDPSKLQGQDRLSYQIFKRDLEDSLEGFQYPSQLIPLNQFFSTPNFFAQLGSGSSLHPFRTVDDYEDFLGRTNGFVEWVDVAIANMRDGVRRGIVQPRIIMEKTLPQLEAHLVNDPEKSLFYQPIRNFPESFTADEKARLTGLYRQTILEKIIPAYRRLHTFVKNDYLPATRATAGMNQLPGGGDWYRYLVK